MKKIGNKIVACSQCTRIDEKNDGDPNGIDFYLLKNSGIKGF